MEHPSPPLSPTPRLHLVAVGLPEPRGDVDHVPRQLRCARAGHGVHHEEDSRLRVWRHDVAVAYCCDPAVEVCQGEEDVQRMY